MTVDKLRYAQHLMADRSRSILAVCRELGAIGPKPSQQPEDLSLAQPQHRRRLPHRQSAMLDLRQRLDPGQLGRAHHHHRASLVRPTTEASPDGRWGMFTLFTSGGLSIDGLLPPPGAVAVQDGPPIEEVLFLRDEMANLCWAVARSVQGPSGSARDRARERDDPRAAGAGPVERAQLDYLLQAGLPARWIPYLPRSSGFRAVELAGAMPDRDGNAYAYWGGCSPRAVRRSSRTPRSPARASPCAGNRR